MTVLDTEQCQLVEDVQPKNHQECIMPFTLEILKLIKDAQQQHGLRHADYQRYRGYCSRRIRRLRKVLKLPQGDRRHFKKRDVSEQHLINPTADERFLYIYVVMAERCWAYAMQLRQESNTEPRKKFHLIQKLRKASVYALQLEELCKHERCDARTKLEAQAYAAWIQGSLEFELHLWLKATENLKKAQVIYEKLSLTLPEDEQLPYKQKVDEIAPSLRYCAYNIGDEKAVDLLELKSQGVLENLETFVAQTKEKTAQVLHEIKWFGIKIPVTIERVRLFLIGIEGLDDSLKNAEDTQAKIKILEDLFIDLRDIISLTRDSVRAEKHNQILLSYLISIRVERTSQRNLLLILQSRRAQDCVRLVDIIIQQTSELMQNDGIKNDEIAKKFYGDQIIGFKILRSFYLAKTHAAQKRWREAAVLFDLTQSTLKTNLPQVTLVELNQILETIKNTVEIEKCKAQANFVLEKEDENLSIVPQKVYKSKKPLIERLDDFREEPQLLSKNPNLVTLPTSMVPIPAKPLFYDLALNFVEFPDLSEKLDGAQRSKQGSGISGFVKGLWGWGKK